jgi:pyruvate carboxylase
VNRKAARAAVKTALEATTLFDSVLRTVPTTFNGAAFVAIVSSAGTLRLQDARDLVSDVNSIQVSIFVQKAPDDAGKAEDSLDDLTAAAIDAIDALDDSIAFQRSDATSPAPLRRIDGKMFRTERLIFTIWGL